MSTPIALAAVAPWPQSQPSPPPIVPAVQPVAAASASGSSADSSSGSGSFGTGSQQSVIYTPQQSDAAPQLYARPASQGTIHPQADSGTAAADAAALNATAVGAPAETQVTSAVHAVANAAYAMVADAPGTMPASVLHPLRGT